jgi:hypothetical protein
MAPRVLSVPLTLGRADRVDPKIAPLGVLATAKNLRVKKDGRLASRTGYQPVSMSHRGEGMTAYDLHEYQGRLIALGNVSDDGYPTDLYEYMGVPTAHPWRGTDESGNDRVTLCPFTNPRQVSGIPQPAGGVSMVDCASGDGYVCTVYKPAEATLCYVQIVRESDDQVIFCRESTSPAYITIRVCFADGRFFFLGTLATNALVLSSFTPGSDFIIDTLVTVEAAAGPLIAGFEISPITNPDTSSIIVAYDRTSTNDLLIKRYTSAGVQEGATIAESDAYSADHLDIEADADDDTINLVVNHTTDTNLLYTYNFAGSTLDGPTTCTVGDRPQLCRLPARPGSAWVEHVAVAINNATGSVIIQYFNQDTHVVSQTGGVGEAAITTRLLAASSEGQPTAVVFGGWVENIIPHGSPTFDDSSAATNALFYVSSSIGHMTTRDLGESTRRPSTGFRLGLSKDASTGRIAWTSTYNLFGGSSSNFTVTTYDLLSTKRRQSCEAGGLLYFAGGTPQVYDGRLLTEVGFNEVPGIRSITQGTVGSLFDSSVYTYAYIWEFNLPDGTYYHSPPSPPVDVTMGVGEDSNSLVLTSPHSLRIALGDAAYGSDVVGVLYRTLWDDTNGAQGSQLTECKRFSLPGNMGSYGQTITVVDAALDSAIATKEVLYTQNGPVENNAPESCAYISASSARIITAGLARQSEFQESKEQELDQPINFARNPAFFGRAPSILKGVLSLDGVRLLFPRNDVLAVTGEGAQNDASDALPQPVEIASPSGLKDWRSLLKAPDGIWFQLDDEKLYRMPRGSGAPTWEGIDVQDTLAAFPVITGACRNRQDDTIVFACQNTEAGTDARILVRSLRTGLWTEDTPPLQTSEGIEAITSYGETLAYISDGIVYVQSASSYADGTSTVIPTVVKTHPLYPFDLGGNGLIHGALLTGEWRSAGTLALRVSYDDGVNFTTYESFTLSGLTVGQTIQRSYDLQQTDTTSAVFEFTFTPSAAGEGVILHNLALLVETTPGLKDLDPAEMT